MAQSPTDMGQDFRASPAQGRLCRSHTRDEPAGGRREPEAGRIRAARPTERDDRRYRDRRRSTSARRRNRRSKSTWRHCSSGRGSTRRPLRQEHTDVRPSRRGAQDPAPRRTGDATVARAGQSDAGCRMPRRDLGVAGAGQHQCPVSPSTRTVLSTWCWKCMASGSSPSSPCSPRSCCSACRLRSIRRPISRPWRP